MAQVCDACGKDNYRTTFVVGRKQWLGAECGCLHIGVIRDADNPFKTNGELVLEHIHGEDGKPLRVTSRRELEAAQKTHNFVHVPTNMDRSNWDRPAQQRQYTVGDLYRRKFLRGHA